MGLSLTQLGPLLLSLVLQRWDVQVRNFLLPSRERKRDGVVPMQNEAEFMMMMRRWLLRMEQIANDEQLSLSDANDLAIVQRHKMLSFAERLQLKQVSSKWVILGMIACRSARRF